MNLDNFKNYIDENKALKVSEKLKEKTLAAAAAVIPEKTTNKIPVKKHPHFMRYASIAACLLIATAIGSGIFKLFIAHSTSATFYDNAQYDTAYNTVSVDAAATADAENTAEESIGSLSENPIIKTIDEPISTFSIDVDTASYINFRRNIAKMTLQEFQNSGYTIRTEEAINYFHYDYDKPTGDCPVAVTTSVGDCPWNTDAKLAVITLAGEELTAAEQAGSNIVFLVDVSGSMSSDKKLPLLKESLTTAIENLNEKDTISIVTYASGVNTILTGAKGSDTDTLLQAINSLQADGSTAGASGLNLAYSVAEDYFIDGGNNRIIIATDGDFNVGPSSTEEIKEIVTQKREIGIFLTVLGFGVSYESGDDRLEALADNGNGGYYVIDCLDEGEKVLGEQFASTLYTIAKDVKLQVEFNADYVESYRLIGYENRIISNAEFDDDTVDAGDLGAGQTVTALYEIVLKEDTTAGLFSVKVRYKQPDSEVSELYEHTAQISNELSNDYYYAAAVAEACLVINNSQYKGAATLEHAYEMAKEYGSPSSDKYKLGFVDILRKMLN